MVRNTPKTDLPSGENQPATGIPVFISPPEKQTYIVCDMCGHKNPENTALCEMCSNYLFD